MKIKTFENEAYVVTDHTDVVNYVTKSSTIKQRLKLNIGDYFINGAVCVHCKDYIRSINQHNFRKCSCGKVAVDGGSHFCRRLGNEEDYINVIEKFYDAKTIF